jgi:hypothetical protein
MRVQVDPDSPGGDWRDFGVALAACCGIQPNRLGRFRLAPGHEGGRLHELAGQVSRQPAAAACRRRGAAPL